MGDSSLGQMGHLYGLTDCEPWGSVSMGNLLATVGWAPKREKRTWEHSSLALEAPGGRK